MRVKYPAMKAELESHTVETPQGRLAGFLVRCTASRKDLGYVWQAGSAWRWQTPNGKHSGERSSQQVAVRVLRDAFDLRRQPSLLEGATEENEVITKAWRAPVLPPMKPRRQEEPCDSRSKNSTGDSTASSKRSAPASSRSSSAATPSARSPVNSSSDDEPIAKIDWSKHATGDVTSALADLLRDKK